MTKKQLHILDEIDDKIIEIIKGNLQVSNKAIEMLEDGLSEPELTILSEVNKNSDDIMKQLQLACDNLEILKRMAKNLVN